MTLGTLYNCLLNYIFAKQQNGTFFLRLDGQHLTPQRIQFQQSFENDIQKFGMIPDFIMKQSERMNLYRRATENLLDHISVSLTI